MIIDFVIQYLPFVFTLIMRGINIEYIKFEFRFSIDLKMI